MLGKLISYEMKAFGRIMLPLYAALLILAFIIGFTSRTLPNFFSGQDSLSGFGVFVLIFLFVSVCVAIFVMTASLSISRFWKNLMGREGYLMFSLPTGIGTIIAAKAISVLIWSAFSAISGALAIMIFIIPELPSLRELALLMNLSFERLQPYMADIFLFMVMMALSLAIFVMQIYASIAIGCQWTSHRLIGSVFAFIGLQILESGVIDILSAIGFLTNQLNQLSFRIHNSLSFVDIQGRIIGLLCIGILIYAGITYFFLDRKLNLE